MQILSEMFIKSEKIKLLVMIGHLDMFTLYMGWVSCVIYSFHMPLFVFLNYLKDVVSNVFVWGRHHIESRRLLRCDFVRL